MVSFAYRKYLTHLKKRKIDHESSQHEIIQLLGKLHQADLIQTNVQPDIQEIYQRAQQQNKSHWEKLARNPISIRISLFDPEKILSIVAPVVRPLFTSTGLALWVIILVISLIFAGSYWPELTSNSIEQTLLPKNLLLLCLIYPFIKLLHELAHAFAVKHWGGEVHDIGVIFVLFIPIPYVDASGSSAFTRKYQRIIVGAAGIMLETFLACISLFVWLAVEPGLISTISFNIIIIAGISTLFFNGNPLLRYDGYFILSDVTGIQNLSSRSNKYIGYLFQRYLFGIQNTTSPAHDENERLWFTFYSPASYIYKLAVLSVLIFIVSDYSLLIGMLLFIYISYNQIVSPLIKHIKFILAHPTTRDKRSRAIVTSSILSISIASIIFLIPFPLVTITQGAISLPDNSVIHTKTSGFITEVLTDTGDMIIEGEIIAILEDPLLQAKINILESQLEELNAQYDASWAEERVKNKIIKERISSIQKNLVQEDARKDSLAIKSTTTGKVIIPHIHDLKGR